MSIKEESFGFVDEKEATLYTLTNSNGVIISFTDFGAILQSVKVPNPDGTYKDIVLGFDNVEQYAKDGNPSFFGATIGPNANRIADAKFSIDDKEYKLAVNDGPNNLHSDENLGYHKRFWNVKETTDNSVTFQLHDEHLNMGFPGKKDIFVTYTLTDENEIQISYEGLVDKPSLLNMTNHSYFNLAGHNSGSIEGHFLQINANYYTPVVEGAIPTGEIAPVEGTVFDFTSLKEIGKEINEDIQQLNLVQGYDHNWVITNEPTGEVKKVAFVQDPESGLAMEVYTDAPGIQFYAGNCIASQTGKDGVQYDKRHGFCLETQYFPNAINESTFCQPIFTPENPYKTTTSYKLILDEIKDLKAQCLAKEAQQEELDRS